MALCVKYFARRKPEDDETSYVSINFTDDGSGAETDNTYESIKSRYVDDSAQTVESAHESTSSGVASDVTSVYPPTPTLTTFKGGDSTGSAYSAKSAGSQDSGTKSASLSSSPRPDQNSQKLMYLRGFRMSPAPPIPPKDALHFPTKSDPRLLSPPPCNENQHFNAYTESATVASRGNKFARDRRPRLPESSNDNAYHEPLAHTGSTNRTGFPFNDPRSVDPSFYNEIKPCCVEAATRNDHNIEPFRGDRYIESHTQAAHIQKERFQNVPSSMSPSPLGGCSFHKHNNHHLQSDVNSTLNCSKSRQKPPSLQQQHFQQQQQQPLPLVPEPRICRSSPADNDFNYNHNKATTAQHYNHHSHHNIPSPQLRTYDRSSPTTQQTNNPKRPPSAANPNICNQQHRHNFREQKSENVASKGSHTFQTHAQVHSPQPEVRGGQNEVRIKSEATQLNHSANKTRSGRGLSPGTALTNGVNNLSLSQNEVQKGKVFVKHSSGKRHVSKCSPFESLPSDVLLKIFSHLPTDHLCKFAQVCRHWYNVVWDHPILWTSIVISNANIDIDRALKYLTRRLSYNTPKVCMILEKININLCSRLTDRGLQTVVKRCPELRYLEMQGCHQITNVGVSEAVSRCVNLERLDVTDCPLVTCIRLMDSVISQSASRHLQRIYLRYLDMSDCPHVTDEDLSTITSQCTQLLFFYLRRCPLITDLGVTYIANNCSSMRELSFSDCKNITDLGLRELAKLRDNLRYLSVAKCEKVSDQGIIHIARHCSKLRYLNVRGCEAVSDKGLEFLAQSCPRLRSLDIGKCDITDEGLYALSMYCPNLRKLGVKSCDAITDKGIVLVAYRCPSLQQLHVQDCCLSPDAYAMVRKYCKRAIIEHTNPGVL